MIICATLTREYDKEINNYPTAGDIVSLVGYAGLWRVMETHYTQGSHNIDVEQLDGEYTADEAYTELLANGYDWYVVEYIDGSYDVKHACGLSSIIECGHDPADYGIAALHQCWAGQELGECPF